MSSDPAQGAYKARIEQQSFRANDEKGGRLEFVVDFTVLRQIGVDGRENPLPTPLRRNTTLYLTPPKPGKTQGGIHMALERLQAIAPDWDGDFGKMDPNTPGHVSLVGREVTVINEGKRDPQSKYDNWSLPSPGGVRERKSDPVAAARAAALLRSLGGAPSAPAAGAASGASKQLDEVPF